MPCPEGTSSAQAANRPIGDHQPFGDFDRRHPMLGLDALRREQRNIGGRCAGVERVDPGEQRPSLLCTQPASPV